MFALKRLRSYSLVILTLVLATLFVALPDSASAQILPACTLGGNCGTCDVVATFGLIAQWFLRIIGGIVVGMFVLGGFFWIISGGSSEKVKKGQQIMVGALIGLGLVLGAWLIVNFAIAAALGTTEFSEVKVLDQNWATFCDRGASTAVNDCKEQPDGVSCNGCTGGEACVCYNSRCRQRCDILPDLAGDVGITNARCMDDATRCEASGGTAQASAGAYCPSSAQYCCITKE